MAVAVAIPPRPLNLASMDTILATALFNFYMARTTKMLTDHTDDLNTSDVEVNSYIYQNMQIGEGVFDIAGPGGLPRFGAGRSHRGRVPPAAG